MMRDFPTEAFGRVLDYFLTERRDDRARARAMWERCALVALRSGASSGDAAAGADKMLLEWHERWSVPGVEFAGDDGAEPSHRVGYCRDHMPNGTFDVPEEHSTCALCDEPAFYSRVEVIDPQDKH